MTEESPTLDHDSLFQPAWIYSRCRDGLGASYLWAVIELTAHKIPITRNGKEEMKHVHSAFKLLERIEPWYTEAKTQNIPVTNGK